ncbi:hypothetical protein OEZ49_14540 [Ruegeria sp. WL0004]|uniref:ABC transmembrane type-1 domain-containing protein n=1 Tax=Ruegeria marisflavi TaxID=2984152 RepID=A0ABT2WUS7_9RHOB|nr:hypothetical protein [Ruegeria sp. WL0004]MCU9838992.1 hypothetical protein [Ruegeria sp. WL0004]
MLKWPLAFTEGLLVSGFGGAPLLPLPWVTVTLIFSLAGLLFGSWRLAAILLGCFTFLAVFGVWEPAMNTFSLVLVIVPFAALMGMAAGVVLAGAPRLERELSPVLDVMQSTPHFAYLAPIVVLFGFGQVPALPDGRLHKVAASQQGAFPCRRSNAAAGPQPGHHADPGNGSYRLPHRGVRTGPWPADRSDFPEARDRFGAWCRHCRAGRRFGPAQPSGLAL